VSSARAAYLALAALAGPLTGAERYAEAIAGYERAATHLHTGEMMDVDLGNSDERRERLVAARLSLLLNMAQSGLKLAQDEAVPFATEQAGAAEEEQEEEEREGWGHRNKRRQILEKVEERCTLALGLEQDCAKAL
jgi:hypothetical protein